MKILALTGGTGCGKSTAAAELRRCGAPILDADEISRSLTAPNGMALPAIRQAFGNSVFHEDGSLNRRALGKLVFADQAALSSLNALLHPMIFAEMKCRIERYRKASVPVLVLDIPLLYETGMEVLADRVLCMTAPTEVQLLRIMERDGIDRATAEGRIAAQLPTEEKARRADYVVSSDRPQEATARAVRLIYEALLEEEKP